jgi:hypothetical protein
MYDVDAWVIGIEESRYEDVGGGLGWELRQDLGLGCRLLLTIQESGARRMLVGVASLVPL